MTKEEVIEILGKYMMGRNVPHDAFIRAINFALEYLEKENTSGPN
jgi:hypothetical protein